MDSAMEVELGILFANGQNSAQIKTTLIETEHPQLDTPIVSGNSSALIVRNCNTKKRCPRAIDMHFYLTGDCVKQGKFLVFWRPGTQNLANYPTKHHPTYHHQQIHTTYLK